MKININDYVCVRLTDYGREVLLFKDILIPQENVGGWSKWQLWSLMSAFGDHICLGCKNLFETEIEIVEKGFYTG